jgi:hypothetical protein
MILSPNGRGLGWGVTMYRMDLIPSRAGDLSPFLGEVNSQDGA